MGSYTANPALHSLSEPYYNIGQFSRKISTESREAQGWFDRALTWQYCFNHDEAINCYLQAIGHDEGLALAYWGVAFCSGPNYNKNWLLFDPVDKVNAVKKCYYYSQESLKRLRNVKTAWEHALITTLAKRFPDDNPDKDLLACNKHYADALREPYQRLGDDIDVLTIFADALMNTANRKLYDSSTGLPNAATPVFEVKEVLERGLKMPGAKTHPGVGHYYIHLMEMSATPQDSLYATDLIRDQIPDTGHTYHMPAHIDVLVGDYRRAVEYGLKATYADDRLFRRKGGIFDKDGKISFYAYYRLHDYHSCIYAAMLAGKSAVALDTCSRMEACCPERMLRVEVPAMANWAEFFMGVRVHVYIRFGMWEELKQLPQMEDKNLYCVTNASRYYGKGIAYAATGDLAQADKFRELFREAYKLIPPTRIDFPNKVSEILKVAHAMLDGEIEYRRANYDVAFQRLRDAIAIEDALPFAEPWAWMLPSRHAYAALSLEQGKVEQAARAYAEDLGLIPTPGRTHQHPNNVWALSGYLECLELLGRHAEAHIIKHQLIVPAAEADIPVVSSCFCRLGKIPSCGKPAAKACH